MRKIVYYCVLLTQLQTHFADFSALNFCLKQQRVIRPMTVLSGSLSSLNDGKTPATHCRPVVPSQRRSAEPFPVVKNDLGPTSDRLLVSITCRVTFLCKVLNFFSSSSKFGRLTRDYVITLKKIFLINPSFPLG